MKTINYTGSSKLISKIVSLLNRKAPLPLDGDGDPSWGTNGQVLTTDGTGATYWGAGGGSGGNVDDVKVNGTSVVDANKVANVTVPTATSDLSNDSNFVSDASYVHTDNNYTTAEKTKLGGIAAGAEVNVQSDWNQADSSADDFIKNKPSIPAAQIQSDWSQNDSSAVDFIKNKPTIPSSSGHTILNRIKTALHARANLWFSDASVSDASADGATKVEVVTELQSESAFDNLATDGTADGVYVFPDSGDEYLTAAMSSYDNTSSGLSATNVQDAIDKLGEKVKYKDVASAFTLHSTATAAQKTFFLYGNVLFYTLWVSFSATPSAEINVVTTTEYGFKPALGICAITNGFANPSDFMGYGISSNKFSINVGNISKIVTGKYYLFTGTALIQ